MVRGRVFWSLRAVSQATQPTEIVEIQSVERALVDIINWFASRPLATTGLNRATKIQNFRLSAREIEEATCFRPAR
jgi:hypothetical protein